uniref:Uncharacterized protein n=1 Tax=Arundo donax TaxID=35708 RepID=A0A0A9BNA2_ARUDO
MLPLPFTITVTTSPVSSSSFSTTSPRPRIRSSHPSGKRGSHRGTCLSGGSLPAAAKLSHPLAAPPESLLGNGFANGTSRTAATNPASSASAPEQSTGRAGSDAPGNPPGAWSSSARTRSTMLGSARPRASARAVAARPRDAM